MTIVYYSIGLMSLIALAHFIYESIIAPTLRLCLQADLLLLKEKLEAIQSSGNKLHDDHYRYLRDSINGVTNGMYRFDVVTLARVKREIANDPALRARVEARFNMIKEGESKEAHAILLQTYFLADVAFALNGLGWAFYILPGALVAACIKVIAKAIRDLVSMPENDLSHIARDGNDNGLSTV